MNSLYQQAKPTKASDWIVCSLIGFIGIIVLSLMVFSSLRGTTPKEKLTSVSGVPIFVEGSTVKGRYGHSTDFLWFTVGDFKMSYGSDTKGYNVLKKSIEEGLEVTMKVSTQRETVFPRDGWVPIYEFISNEDTILSYEDSLSESSSGKQAGIFVGLVLMGASVFGLKKCLSNRNIT